MVKNQRSTKPTEEGRFRAVLLDEAIKYANDEFKERELATTRVALAARSK